ncbi:MAG: hydrogenase expression/formation protein HypE [Actinomycetes bacterium]
MTHPTPDASLDPAGWLCPLPLRDSPTIVMGHGGGGRLSAELVEHLFVPAFSSGTDSALARLGDSAVIAIGGEQLAFTTDSYVVRPRWFPGGSIGDLAVNGTVNDLAMMGARPLFLTVGFILEEGLEVAELGRVVDVMGRAAREAGVTIVAGDTKVVDAGHGDGLYVNTAGVGVVPSGVSIGPERARPGDVVIVSGPLGMHGIAVLSVRDGLEFGSQIVSDSAPLGGLVGSLVDAHVDVHTLRDPTRGGLAATLNEIAAASGTGVRIEERLVPVPDDVRAACGFLGLDPMCVANEGKLVAFVAPHDADRALTIMRADTQGAGATVIGEVVEDHPGVVVARTPIGGTRVVDLPLAEQLPRIC